MTKFWTLTSALAGVAMAAPYAQAAAAEPVKLARLVPPPISAPKGAFFKAHPEARAKFLAGLAAHGPGRAPATKRVVTTNGGTWQTVTAGPSSVGFGSPVLLTDGTVIAQDANAADWWKLTPDINGNYATGTWSQIASLPVIGGVQYAPLYHSTALLPDGRVIIMGGEYNGSGTEVWTNLGAIYDPVANTWTAVTAPAGSSWSMVGDAESVMLGNGKFMLASCCAYPSADAILNESKLTWTTTGSPTGAQGSDSAVPYQDEQGYELLPSGNVLTIDVWAGYSNSVSATAAEIYNPKTGVWGSAGNTPVSLVDPLACGNFEIGPAVVRGDGKVIAFGGNSGCVTGATADPTAIYNISKNSWAAGPNVPATCGSNGTTSCTLADAPAALLPNGNILFAASSGYGDSPTHFFEFTTKNVINQVSDTVDYAGSSSSFYYNFLVLPSGQILSTDFSNIAELYTPVAGTPAGLAPTITSVPTTLTPGTTYAVKGKQLSGRSGGAYYGDDAQMATNYPIVRITNGTTGHVFYARVTKIGSYSIQSGISSTASFTLPAAIETGASSLVVVANGIASAPVAVTVN